MQVLTYIQVLFNTTTTTKYAILDLLLLNADTDVSTSLSTTMGPLIIRDRTGLSLWFALAFRLCEARNVRCHESFHVVQIVCADVNEISSERC
jgi:hypothetical protein